MLKLQKLSSVNSCLLRSCSHSGVSGASDKQVVDCGDDNSFLANCSSPPGHLWIRYNTTKSSNFPSGILSSKGGTFKLCMGFLKSMISMLGGISYTGALRLSPVKSELGHCWSSLSRKSPAQAKNFRTFSVLHSRNYC